MGLKTAPSNFARYVGTLLAPLIAKGFCSVYLDDILIHSRSTQEHHQHLRELFQLLNTHGLKVKPSKSLLFASEVTFLGQRIRADGTMTPLHNKLEALRNFPAPTCGSECASFLGLANWFRKFIPFFSKLTAPLSALTSKETWDPGTWTPECQVNFEELKKLLCDQPTCVALYDSTLPTALWVDASKFALGSCLLQRHQDGWRPVAFHSRKFNQAESNYSVRDKELLAIHDSFRTFEVELRSVRGSFTVVSDHHSLQHYATTKLQTERLIRWSEFLALFSFNIVYRAGATNTLADALSRDPRFANLHQYVESTRWLTRFSHQSTQVGEDDVVCNSVEIPSLESAPPSPPIVFDPHLVTTVSTTDTQTDPTPPLQLVNTTFTSLSIGIPSELQDLLIRTHRQDFPGLSLSRSKDGLLRTVAGQLFLPPDAEEPVLFYLHTLFSHVGSGSTYKQARQLVWCKYLKQKILKVVNKCDHCRTCKHRRQRTQRGSTYQGHFTSPPLVSPILEEGEEQRNDSHFSAVAPFEKVGIDFTFGLPKCQNKNGLAVFRDMATHYTVIIPISHNLTSDQLSSLMLDRWIQYFGVPTAFVSDNDSRFLGEAWESLCETLKVKPFKTSVYNPRANGSVERTNSYIGELLRTLCHEIGSTANWIDLVPYLQSSINSAPGPTGVSANRLLFGRDFNGIGIFQSVTSSLSPDERHSLLVTVQKQLLDKLVAKTNKLNQHAVKLDVKVGDMVELRTTHLSLKQGTGKKLVPLYVGPFPVTRTITHGNKVVACELELPPTWHVSRTWNVHYLRQVPPDSLCTYSPELELEQVNDVSESPPDTPEPQVTDQPDIQFHSRKRGQTFFRVKLAKESDWRIGRVWSEATLRETPSGTKALDQYYHNLASRNRARVHVAYVCEQ